VVRNDVPWWDHVDIYTHDDGTATAYAIDGDKLLEETCPSLDAAKQWARECAKRMGVEEDPL